MLLLIIILILIFGIGPGYYWRGEGRYNSTYGGFGIGAVLLILAILYFLGFFRRF